MSRVLLSNEFLLRYQNFVPPSGIYASWSCTIYSSLPPERLSPWKHLLPCKHSEHHYPNITGPSLCFFSEWDTMISLDLEVSLLFCPSHSHHPWSLPLATHLISAHFYSSKHPLLWTTAPLIPKTFLQSPWELLSIAPNSPVPSDWISSQTAPSFLWFSVHACSIALTSYAKKIYSCWFYPLQFKTWMHNWGLN